MLCALLAAACLLCGCGEDEPAGQETDDKDKAGDKLKGARRPLRQLHAALRDADREAFLGCFEANDRQRRVLSAMYDAYAAQTELNRKMAEAYGSQAEAAAPTLLQRLSEPSWVETVEVAAGQRRGAAIASLDGTELQLVQGRVTVATDTRPEAPMQRRVWKIDPEVLVPSNAEMATVQQMVGYYEQLARAGERLVGRVGQAGETAESIRDKWAEARAQAVAEYAP